MVEVIRTPRIGMGFLPVKQASKALARSHLKASPGQIRKGQNKQRNGSRENEKVSVWYKVRKNSNLQLRLLAGVGEYLLGCANTIRELDGFRSEERRVGKE